MTPHQAAYAAGEQAYHAGDISLEAWHLYEKLVFWAGEKGYCWWSIKKISNVFKRCARQVGRWFKELLGARLIDRKRRGNGPAETHITAFRTTTADESVSLDEPMSDRDPHSMSDRSFKESPEKIGGGSAAASFVSEPDTTEQTETEQLLRGAGIISRKAISELLRKPADIIRRRYEQWRRVRNAGPGLLVYAIREDVDLTPSPRHKPRDRAAEQRERHQAMRREQLAQPQPTWEDMEAYANHVLETDHELRERLNALYAS